MRIISFDGRIGKNAQILTAKNGRQYLRMSVANNIYTSKEERTDWFDVTCYDEFIVEKKGKYLTKGTYVIVTGTITTEVKTGADGRSWINHYVNASSIDLPRFGKSQDESARVEEPAVSVYTASTPTQRTYQENDSPSEPTISVQVPQYNVPKIENNDDLPF